MKIYCLTKNFSNLMKKVNFKKVLIAFVAVFALMFIGVEKAEAQAVNEFSTGLYDPAPGTFLGTDQAKDVLVNTIANIKTQVTNLGGPTAPGAQQLYRVGLYYSAIYDEVLVGKSVSAAIGSALKPIAFKTTNSGANLSRNDLKNMRQNAIDLLK